MIRYTVLLNSSVNFIIYCVAGARFRAVLVELLGNVNTVKDSQILMNLVENKNESFTEYCESIRTSDEDVTKQSLVR